MKILKQMYGCMEVWRDGNDNSKRRWIATQPAVARNDGRSGFTLVELVIVIAIVIILSVVSVPIYKGYTRNAKMSEGYALLGTILSAQKTYYSQYGNFLYRAQSSGKYKYTANEEVLGINAQGNKYFTSFCVAYMGGGDTSEGFYAFAKEPEELRMGAGSYLRMHYNMTKGASFAEVENGHE